MKFGMNLLRKATALFRREKLDREMSEEMNTHLELQVREYERRGMAPDEARYAALRAFGGVEQIKARVRDQRGWGWLEQTWQDVRIAVRGLRHNRCFTIVAVLTLGFGIGANTAIFAFFNALSLRALPVAEPDRLVLFRSLNGDESFSYPTFERLTSAATTLAGTGMFKRMPDSRAMIASGF
jgi:hypothetical protein